VNVQRTFFLVAILAGGCGYSEEEMRAKTREIERLRGELNASQQERQRMEERLTALSAENETMSNRLRELGENVEALRAQSGALATDLEAARRREEELRRRQQAAEERLSTFRSMLERFRAMIASGQLRVRIVRGRMVVELAENILFDSGQAELKDQGKAALQQVAQVLAQIPNRDFQVAGHTDNVPIHTRRFPSNWELSTARAVTVAKFLGENGVASARLSAAGYADSQPSGSNDTEEGRRQNRRIEIVLMPNLDELPDLSSLQSQESS
jgi:chemotaxis protein MotB